jgi:uncharacterized membrane protein
MDSKKKSIFKTATWYAAHLVVAGTVALAVTHSVRMSAILASAEIVWEAFLFYGHERVWAKFGHKVN